MKRAIKKEDQPVIYGGTADVPTKVWEYKDLTLVQLGMIKAYTYIHMEKGVIPWLHPYFSDMSGFFLEYAEALFPYGMQKDHYDKRVCSTISIDKILEIVRKYKSIVRDDPSVILEAMEQLKISSDKKKAKETATTAGKVKASSSRGRQSRKK